MSTHTAIQTHELGKRYTLGVSGRGYGTLRESIAEAIKKPLRRRNSSSEPRSDQLWALRDLSLKIDSGEVVGLVGHNGAGKSTLLKILSRITEPSSGHADVTGRVGSLLEVGTGFHPELTGRENIFLNGAILGMRRSEIRARFDEIVSFAEIDRFLDTPVKRYSSGMSGRLAFAVAAHLEPEILLVDEVLAVGDASFQRKSLAKMSEVARAGRTVLFVSHNLAIIQALCQRGILLERGRAQADGPVSEILDHYLAGLERASVADLIEREDRDGRGWQHTLLKKVEMVDASSGQKNAVVGGRPAKLVVEVTELLPGLECRVTIANSFGQPISVLDSEISAPADARDPELGPRIECEIPIVPLLPGRYRLDVGLKANSVIQDGLQAAAFFDVEPGVMEGRQMAGEGSEGSVAFPHCWRLPP
ncbi:MAG TPA: ABC transporter ATP-binding protein [Solirubrobacterales bacterium]|nr:ABC transporter ATP-binding protein [Solirubrobacterales bacterium]